MWEYLSSIEGCIVSLGAGYAFLEAMTAILNPAARIVASDRNTARIEIAKQALGEIPNLSLEVLDIRKDLPAWHPNGFLLLDVLHHLSPDVQESILATAAKALPQNGRIIIKDCGTRPFWKKWVNYLNDAIGAPFERTYPRSESDWAELLQGFGLHVTTTRIDAGSPYAHILVMARKPEQAISAA